MITIGNIFDDFIRYEIQSNDEEIKIKRDEFLELFCGKLTLDKLIYFVYKNLSSKSYSKERFLELCFENDILDTDLLSGLFLHVHTQAHLYSYFRDYQLSEEKILGFFERIEKPLLDFEAKTQFDNLPNEFVIFRGLQTKPKTLDQMGFCWTLNESVAKKFALADSNSQNGFILKGTSQKKVIYGYILSRDEEEILINSKLVSNKEVRTIYKCIKN